MSSHRLRRRNQASAPRAPSDRYDAGDPDERLLPMAQPELSSELSELLELVVDEAGSQNLTTSCAAS